TIQDVLDSPWVVYPFHVLDCCLVTDAGGAVVLTTMDRARDLGVPLVEVLGSAVAHTHHQISQMPDLTTTPARLSGQAAYAQAGVGPGDIDVAELYDSFTYTVLVSLEDLGFCAKGEGGDFVTGQRTAPGGEFPLNTSGGGLSYTHPGMFGMFLLIEAVQQLRGECGQRQVPGAEVALVNGMGGYLSSAATAILARVWSGVYEHLPQPRITPAPDAAPFWEAARRHEWRLPYCRRCSAYFFYPRPHCPTCGSREIEWRAASGRGRLYSF